MLWQLLKRAVLGLALIPTSPLILATWIEQVLLGRRCERIFGGCKEMLAVVPTVVGQYLRGAYYWACCTGVSADVCLSLGAMIAHRETRIGRRVVIGSYSIIGQAEIGDDVMIASRVSLLSGKYQHGRPHERAATEPPSGHFETIRVGRNSWIGEGAVILADVGENCTIGAGAVLQRNAPDNSTLMGNPARRVDRMSGPGQESVPAKEAQPPISSPSQ